MAMYSQPNCFRGWRSHGHGMTPASPTCRSDLDQLGGQIGVPGGSSWPDRVTIQRDAAAPEIDSEFHRGQSAYDRYYGDPTITPNPNLRPLDKGAVLRGEDGAQRSRHVRRLAGRRAGPSTARGRQRRSTGSTRSATPRRMHSGPRIPVRARRSRKAWCTATSPPRMPPKPTQSVGLVGVGLLFDLVPEFRWRPGSFAPSDLRRGNAASASSSSLIIVKASSRSFA